MSALLIFVMILKIIGIILLTILGILIVCLLLILFFPIFYNANGFYKNNKPDLTVKVNWLFGFLSVKYILQNENPITIKVLGIQINKKKNKKDKNNKKDKSKNTKKKNDLNDNTNHASADIEKSDCLSQKDQNITIENDKTEKTNKNITEDSPKDIKAKVISEETDTKESGYDKLKKIIELIQSDDFKNAFSYSKDKLIKLIRHILPRKYKINALLGFEDPSITGIILAISSMAYPLTGDRISIKGDFENEIIDVNGYIKGHITVIRIVTIGLMIYFNKNIKRIIKSFKEVI